MEACPSLPHTFAYLFLEADGFLDGLLHCVVWASGGSSILPQGSARFTADDVGAICLDLRLCASLAAAFDDQSEAMGLRLNGTKRKLAALALGGSAWAQRKYRRELWPSVPQSRRFEVVGPGAGEVRRNFVLAKASARAASLGSQSMSPDVAAHLWRVYGLLVLGYARRPRSYRGCGRRGRAGSSAPTRHWPPTRTFRSRGTAARSCRRRTHAFRRRRCAAVPCEDLSGLAQPCALACVAA